MSSTITCVVTYYDNPAWMMERLTSHPPEGQSMSQLRLAFSQKSQRRTPNSSAKFPMLRVNLPTSQTAKPILSDMDRLRQRDPLSAAVAERLITVMLEECGPTDVAR